ncbi:MAG: ISLre2 family transposase [Actinomycetota bacterium]|nr:ISLre2 family transposase [Actinomycetota bacterium]
MSDLSQLISRLVEEKDDFNELEDGLVKELFEVGRKVLRGILEHMDAELMKERAEGLRHLGVRERTVLTRLGVLRIKRRYYRERGGGTRFLLDEALGWGGGLAATPALEARALKMCSESSFRCAADNLSFFLAENIRHTLLHEMVGKRGSEAACAKQSLACDLFESGVIPASEGRRAERLFMEADGCMISLQRAGRRKHELKAGISYEGWEQVGKDKWRLAEKRSFLSAAPADDFLAAWSADLATVYDYRGVSEAVWSSDGASWLARGPDLFSVTVAQLDRFHLARALRRALGSDPEASRLISLAREGQGNLVIEAMEERLARTLDPKRRKHMAEAISLLKGASSRLADWSLTLKPRDGDRSLGCMESNVDKLVADRFKKRGMSWSVSGADHMCKIIELSRNGELAGWCRERRASAEGIEVKAFEKLKREVRRDPERWCQAYVPLLSSKSGQPWVKDVLRHLAGLAVSA